MYCSWNAIWNLEENDERSFVGRCSYYWELDVAKVISFSLYLSISFRIQIGGFVYVIEAHQFITQIKNIETI